MMTHHYFVRYRYSHDVTPYDVGLVVNPAFQWLGASSNGKVKYVAGSSPIGLLEIKCPYTYRDLSPQEASLKPDLFCKNVASKVCQQQNHKYFSN